MEILLEVMTEKCKVQDEIFIRTGIETLEFEDNFSGMFKTTRRWEKSLIPFLLKYEQFIIKTMKGDSKKHL